jgi:DNA-binding NarL/FixJ family response regulator
MSATRTSSASSPHRATGSRRLVIVDPVDPPVQREPEIQVVIAAGDNLARAGLEALLEVEPGISVAGSVADGAEIVDLAAQIRPNVLLIDIALPGVDAIEVARRVHADPEAPGVEILVLGGSEDDEELFAALRAGARGFLPPDVRPAELGEGIRAVAAGEAALSPGIVGRMIAEITSRPDPGLPAPEQLDELTPREREVMGLVAAGLTNDEIADHLVISRATAKTHVSRTLLKLHARDRAQLVTLAYETGLVLPSSASVLMDRRGRSARDLR